MIAAGAAFASALGEFESRRRGPGQFVTRESLAQAERKTMGDALRLLRRTYITPLGAKGVVLRSAVTTFSCPSAIMLDQRPLYYGVGDPFDVNAFSPAQFEALEYYDDDTQTPVPLRGLGKCGLLVLHSRR